MFSFSNTEKKQLNELCIQLKTDIRYAQKMSMAQNKEYAILFDEVQKKYSILGKNQSKYEVLTTCDISGKVTSIQTNATNSIMIFTKRGTVQNGFTISIKTKKYKVDITVLPSTGRAEIKEITAR